MSQNYHTSCIFNKLITFKIEIRYIIDDSDFERDFFRSILWLPSAEKRISPWNHGLVNLVNLLETFLYSKFVQGETFF